MYFLFYPIIFLLFNPIPRQPAIMVASSWFYFSIESNLHVKSFLSPLRLNNWTLSSRLKFHSYSAIYCMQVSFSTFSFPNVLIIYRTSCILLRQTYGISSSPLSIVLSNSCFQSHYFVFFQLLYNHQCCCFVVVIVVDITILDCLQ